MVLASLRRLPGLSRLLAATVISLLAVGCMRPMSALLEQGPPPMLSPAAAKPPTVISSPATAVVRTAHTTAADPSAATPLAASAAFSINEVLRLADERNARIAQARSAVDARAAAEMVAEHSHIPNLLRTEPYHRETAEAKLWQQRAELARVRSEVLQEAGNTFVDWLTALRGEALTRELEKKDQELLTKAQKLAKDEKAANVLVESIQTMLTGRRLAIARLHQQAEGAAAKLAYLINQGGSIPLSAEILEPVDLVDVSATPEVLVRQAQDTGPGVAELRGLEAAIQKALAEAKGADLVCKVTHCCSICARLQEAEARLREAQQAEDDLAGKLEAAVREARAAILSGREQITLGSEQIRHASESYRLARLRLDDQISNQTLTDVVQSIRGLEAGHLGHVQAVNAYNKAEVRLLVLLGQAGVSAGSAQHSPVPLPAR
jgi:outer membrane protein TolC